VSPLDYALSYAGRGWAVFPALAKNRPAVKWKDAATTDQAQIRKWWQRWPNALIGLLTGEAFVVLDVDVRASPTGFDTLERLGFPLWFSTPTVNTPSGGSHGYFRCPDPPIRNTNGGRGRGIGPQLDWRGLGGYVIAPSPSSGYEWDPHLGIDTPMAEVPTALLPKSVSDRETVSAAPQSDGLTRYAEGALDGECFSIGTLAGAGQIPTSFARDTLRWAAMQMVSYDPARPWLAGTIEAKVNKAFDAGLRLPRGGRS
jgi:hypothetical protein